MKIGCHLSASAGYLAMAKEAHKINADCFQFFTRNPRGGAAKKIDPKDIDAFLEFTSQNNIGPIMAHAPYTLNACSKDEKIRTFAVDIFADDLRRLEYTPGSFYNFHPGSHVQQGVEKGIDFIVEALNTVLFEGQRTTVLLETMSGKGSEIGSSFQELRTIIDRVNLKQYMGVCLDTCHVWDAGYDIVHDIDGVINEFDKVVGLDRLKAIHLNDSLNERHSSKDRHAKIGKGTLGLEAIIAVVNHPKLKNLPFYLETPNDIEGYAEEIAIIRSLSI